MNAFNKVRVCVKRAYARVKDWVKHNKKRAVALLCLAFLVFVVINEAIFDMAKPEEVDYTDFVSDLQAGNIDYIYYHSDSETMRYTLHNKETRSMSLEDRAKYKHKDSEWRMTTYPANTDFRKEVLGYGTQIKIKTFEPVCEVIISLLMSLGIPIFIFILLYRVLIGKTGSLDENSLIEKSDVRFSDVIGHDEVISDLQFIVSLMKKSAWGNPLGAQIPRGILFSGEPGTGKTLLAKAVAGESGVPFLYMNASSFIELYVGTGARRVRALFKRARELAPCVLFIDEIDAVGRVRGRHGANSEDHQTLNALLQEMDGFNTKSGVFVIAATNDADSLDKALTRAGRFDRQVVVSPPKDWKVRKSLFEHYLRDVNNTVDIDLISRQTVGFTGADINAVVNEAKLIATSASSFVVTTEHLEEAIDKRIFKGNRTAREEKTHDNEIVAYHEAGHAVMAYMLGLPIARASIIGSTSGVGGMVMQAESDSQFKTKTELLQQVMVSYGGRCSEQIKFGEVTTGATSDITNATKILKLYVEKYGFNSDMGLLDLSVLRGEAMIDESKVLTIISDMSKALCDTTLSALKANYSLVECIAVGLLQHETLSGEEISAMLSRFGIRRFDHIDS